MRTESFVTAIQELGSRFKGVLVYGSDGTLLEDLSDFTRFYLSISQQHPRMITHAADLEQTLDLFEPSSRQRTSILAQAKGKEVEAAFALLEDGRPLSLFVISSSDLTSKSAAVVNALSHPDVAVLGYYQRNIQQLEAWLHLYEKHRAALQLSVEARRYVIQWFAESTEPITLTLDRLALLKGNGELSLQHIKSLLKPHDAVLDDLLDAVSTRDVNRVLSSLNEVLELNDAIPLLRTLLRFFQQIESGYAVNDGRAPQPSQYMQLSPPVFFPQKARFERALKNWRPHETAQAIGELYTIERQVKLNYEAPAEILQQRFLNLLTLAT